MTVFRSAIIGFLAVIAACDAGSAQAPRPPNHFPVTIGAHAAAVAGTAYRDTLKVGDSAVVAANAANGAAPAGHVATKTRVLVYVGDTVVVVGAAGTVAPPPPPPPPPPPSGGWNLPARWTVVCQTGAVTSMTVTSSTVAFGGPKPCTWNKNGGTGAISLANAAAVDPQPSGYRVTFPAGALNDPAWDMYLYHAAGTGSYYIGWKQRWQPVGSYAALLAALNSGDSKAWAPKGPAGGDLTIMSFLAFNSIPIIGLNFQGVDGHNIPNNNSSATIAGTIPATPAMVLPGVAAGKGGWDREEVVITSSGTQSTSRVCFYVNGTSIGCATGVTNANAWNASEQYLSRSVYSGNEAKATYTDIDSVLVAVH